MVVAGTDRLRHLPEESSRFGFAQSFAGPYVRVQVSVRAREHEVRVLVSHQNLVQRVDVRLRVQAIVRGQQRAALSPNNLQYK